MRKTAQRFLDDLKRDDLFFDVEDAEKYCDFIEEFIHLWEGEWRGQKVILYPYQKFIVQNIFGWKVKATGNRRFRDAYIQTAKKQAKTTLMAAIAYAHLIIDETDPTPQIIVGANNEEQAKICVNCAGKMVDVSPTLQEMEIEGELTRLKYGDEYYRITYTGGGRDGSLKAISKDIKTKAGKNPSLIIIDEFMAAPTDELLKELRNAQTLRTQPLMIVITTPGMNKMFPCYAKLRRRAMGVLDKKVDLDDLFVNILELDEEKWEDQKEWIKANPIIEYIPSVLSKLQNDYKIAKEEGGSSIVDFKTKNLGIWCDAASVWIPKEIWVKNHNPKLKVEDIDVEGYSGLDLSSTRDINSFGCFFPNAFELDKMIHAFVCLSWLPHDNIIYRSRDYSLFVDRKEIKTMPGNHINEDFVLEDILGFRDKHNFDWMFYDKFVSTFVPQKLSGIGVSVHPISMKGFAQSAAMKEIEKMLYAEEIEHFGNSLLEMAVANTVAKFDNMGQHIRPEKEHPENKIDPMVAKILSVDCWDYAKLQPKEEIWADVW